MCIIAYAPRGSQIEEKTIRIMFKGNPHGAGIMWKPTDSSQVEILKGFMKVDDLLRAYRKIPVECEKAIHCRIATSGKVSVGCCHPFPVRVKTSAMKQEKDSAYLALMHNGVIGYCTPSGGMNADYSDTMVFAAQFLYPLQKQLDTAAIQMLIENSTNSRLLIFRKDAETLMFGNWKYENGIYYSNDNYKERTYYGYGYTGGGYWQTHDYDAQSCKWVPKAKDKTITTNTTTATTVKDTNTTTPALTASKTTLEEDIALTQSLLEAEEADDYYDDYNDNNVPGDNYSWYGTIMLEVPEVMQEATLEEVIDDLEAILEPDYEVCFTSYEFIEMGDDTDTKFLYADYCGYIPMGITIIGDYKVSDHSNDHC